MGLEDIFVCWASVSPKKSRNLPEVCAALVLPSPESDPHSYCSLCGSHGLGMEEARDRLVPLRPSEALRKPAWPWLMPGLQKWCELPQVPSGPISAPIYRPPGPFCSFSLFPGGCPPHTPSPTLPPLGWTCKDSETWHISWTSFGQPRLQR